MKTRKLLHKIVWKLFGPYEPQPVAPTPEPDPYPRVEQLVIDSFKNEPNKWHLSEFKQDGQPYIRAFNRERGVSFLLGPYIEDSSISGVTRVRGHKYVFRTDAGMEFAELAGKFHEARKFEEFKRESAAEADRIIHIFEQAKFE